MIPVLFFAFQDVLTACPLPGMVKSSNFLSILSYSISISYPSIMAPLKWGCEDILPVSNSLLQVLASVSFCLESAGIPTLNTQVADLDSMTPAIFCFELETRWRTWTDSHQSVISQALLQDAVFFCAFEGHHHFAGWQHRALQDLWGEFMFDCRVVPALYIGQEWCWCRWPRRNFRSGLNFQEFEVPAIATILYYLHYSIDIYTLYLFVHLLISWM